MDKMEIIEKAINLLQKSKLTSYQIARMTEISELSINNWRNNKKSPTPPNARILMNCLENLIKEKYLNCLDIATELSGINNYNDNYYKVKFNEFISKIKEANNIVGLEDKDVKENLPKNNDLLYAIINTRLKPLKETILQLTTLTNKDLLDWRTADINKMLHIEAQRDNLKSNKQIVKQGTIPAINERFLQILAMKEVSGYQIAQEIPVLTESGISHIRLGRNKPSEKYLNAILEKYPDIDKVWLLTGEGEMLKPAKTSSLDNYRKNYIEQTEKELAEAEEKTDFKGLPLIPYGAVAGIGGNDNEGIETENFEIYKIPEFEYAGADFFIRVSGSSMYPKYSNGDILGIRKVKDILFFQWGKIYVIDSSQGVLVKRVYEDKDNPDNVLLVSENKEKYPPFTMPKEDIRSLSIVLGVVRME
jgi:phage repressor protein C with HTH and peptisase S24 domain